MAHSVELHFLYLAIPVVYIRFSQMAKGAPVMQLYYTVLKFRLLQFVTD